VWAGCLFIVCSSYLSPSLNLGGEKQMSNLERWGHNSWAGSMSAKTTAKETFTQGRTKDKSWNKPVPVLINFSYCYVKSCRIMRPWYKVQTQLASKFFFLGGDSWYLNWYQQDFTTGGPQRRRDICGRTTSIWQFSSEMQQTWHSYYSRPQKKGREWKFKKCYFNAFSRPLKIYDFYEVQTFHSPKELKYLTGDVSKVSSRL
jgi:hypothetical protein